MNLHWPMQSISRTEKMYLVLVGLLSFCSTSFSQECQVELQENVDFPGNDITFVYSPDVYHCRELCTQHATCLFFTFVRPDWTRDDRHFRCYLKSTSSGRPNTQTPILGVTSGFSLKSCSLNTKPCLPNVYHNVDFPGSDYRFLFTASYEDCQTECTEDPMCSFFTFANEIFTAEKIRYKCHLKSSWTITRPPIVEAKTNVVSGFSHITAAPQFSKTCERKLFPNADIPGSDVEMIPAASPEHCHALCSAHAKCTFFSFSRDDFKCYLKNNPNEMVLKPKNGITSGIPSHFCDTDNSWMKVPFENIDFTGSDIRFKLLDDADSCQQTCTEEPRCQFYTYDNERFFDPVKRRRCYLKRVITIPAPPKVTKLANVVSGFTQRNCVQRV